MRRDSVVLVLLALLALASPARAQQLEVGGSYTLLSLTYPDQIPNGFGGWLAWDAAGIGLDVGVNFFPEDHPIIGRQTQVLAGVRSGARSDRFGLFGRVRPGVLHFSRRFFAPEIACIAIFPTPEACLASASNFALDVGGTVALYPTNRTVVRIDLGDTLVRFGRVEQDAVWRHNLQVAAGAGVRF